MPSWNKCQVTYVPSHSSVEQIDHAEWFKCQVIEIWSSCLWLHKQICKPFLSQLMDKSWSFEDKDKSILIPYAVIMQPIRKFEWIKKQNGLSSNMDESQLYIHTYP